jgi:pSer/pThr/pTyr-binding forkhead associated (FHA) protein
LAIVLAISGRQPLEFDAESITVGSDPAGTIALTDDDRIKPRHAVIRRVAGRWLVEAREGDSIQVGNSEPARLHWLNAGDVIHLVENGPKITFQPSRQEPVASAAPLVPVAPAPLEASFPLSTQVSPIERKDLPPLFDSLYEPIAKPKVTPIASPQVSPNRETREVAPSQQSEKRKRRENAPRPTKIKPVEIADQNPEPVIEVLSTHALPRLQGEGASFSRSGTTSDATFGWVVIWVAVGLGALLVGTIIWFVSFPAPANGDERMSPVPASRQIEGRASA